MVMAGEMRDEGAAAAAAPDIAARLVALGASAGGLEALTEFLGGVDPGHGVVYVIAQHLAPTHPSLLVELLTPATRLPVRLAEDGDVLTPDLVLVVPPDRDVALTPQTLSVTKPGERLTPRPSIDMLFETAAQTWGDAVTAVVLSGTGSDGAEGLRAVHASGGLSMVQSPDEAKFAGMPIAALATGVVDVVASAHELGTRSSLLDLRSVSGEWHDGSVPDPDMLAAVTAQLRRSLGTDFSGYKERTLSRQVQRRMAVIGAQTLDDYFAVLAQDKDEAQHLASNLLVTVTSFFRDPEAYEALRDVLRSLLDAAPMGEQIRVWVPGCATGEEVYSLGMLVSDLLGHPEVLSDRLKIFGTDLDEASLAVARRGRYPESAREHIPVEYRERFTVEQDGGFVVSERLRACTVFARHDVAEDPPFPRIDLLSCRNTLIYFTEPLQRRVLSSFGYSLRSGGVLFLGRAENLDSTTRGFTGADAQWRIFRRTEEEVERPNYATPRSLSAYSRPVGPDQRVSVLMTAPAESHDEVLEALVRSSGQVLMVVDENLDLVEVVGDVAPFCRVPEGRVTTSVMSLLRPELQEEARALLLLARTQGSVVVGAPETLHDPAVTVQLEVRPLVVGGRELQVLAFEVDTGQDPVTRVERDIANDALIRQLETQLLDSQRTLRRSLAELQATNEELEASSEELQAASEELQAANEELESSNEELQATNEELGTLNQELRSRAEQLTRLNEVLENIQESLDQGMVIVNAAGAVVRFSPSAVRLFALMDTDVGRLLQSVPTTIPVEGLDEAIHAVVSGHGRQRLEVQSERISYLMEVLPFVGGKGTTEGAIVTMTDVTEMLELRATLEAAIAGLEEREVLLKAQATYDSVTGLLNRGAFSEAVVREIARARRAEKHLALVWVDLDRFKEVNDGSGHESGDAALRMCADRISEVLRDGDFVGRLGGDEFGVTIADYRHDAELDAIVERIVVALRDPFDFRGQEVRVSGSLGVALFPADADSAEELLRAADAAMYSAKRAGGDARAYFDESMNTAADERRVLRERLDRAIREHEFVLHFQPIVSLPGLEPRSVEALLRWNRDGEIVSAGEFIPFAEETGQIRALGMETLSLLRDDIARLHASGFGDIGVSVNMSVMQLEDRLLTELLGHWPTPGGLEGVTIEILESAFLPDRPHALRTVHQLSSLGARVAVDDYGSGYSNLKLLENLSPDFLKLDRSFLSVRHEPAARRALLTSAVVIAGVVGARVIAEGAETDADLDLLTEVGADMVQGFVVAQPMPVDELEAWLAARLSR